MVYLTFADYIKQVSIVSNRVHDQFRIAAIKRLFWRDYLPGLGKQIISKATHVAGAAEQQSPYISKLVINTLFRYYSSMLV